MIRLEHSGSANGTLLATFSHSGTGVAKANFPVYRSTDNGVTWTSAPIGTVTDTQHGWDLDGPTLYELPQAEGSLPAGTLLAAGTAWNHGDYTQQAVEVFVSTDQGAHWTYRSSCAAESGTANTIGHGIWEPEFMVTGHGLICYYSDERPSANNYAQVLAHTVSTDGGLTWGGEVYDVALQNGVDRPGMTTVVALPNGTYAMTYEDCKAGADPDQACDVYLKTSSDAESWNPGSLGTRIETSDHRFLLHTPYLTWSCGGRSQRDTHRVRATGGRGHRRLARDPAGGRACAVREPEPRLRCLAGDHHPGHDGAHRRLRRGGDGVRGVQLTAARRGVREHVPHAGGHASGHGQVRD